MANANGIYKNFLEKGGARFEENAAADREMIIRRMYQRILIEMATNRYQWHGLPNSVNMRFLELTLTLKGISVFFYDQEYNKFMALRGHSHMMHNIMDEPTMLRVTGQNNYKSKTLKAVQMGETITGEAVAIWSNYLRIPDWDIIEIYSHRLAMIDTTIEINMRNARRTKVAVVDENTKLSMDNAIRQIDEGQPVIRLTNPDLLTQLTAIDFGADPNAIEKLHIIRVRMWNECMGLLGINSANQDKKERLVADEVNANDDQITATQAVNLNARRQAIDLINKRWPELLRANNGPISVEIGGVADAGVPEPMMLNLDNEGGDNA